MSDIEKAVQAAIEEFGDDAHKRFVIKRKAIKDGDMFGSIIIDNADILRAKDDLTVSLELKPLPELFAHGVEFYGMENEILMWQISERGIWCNLQGEMPETMTQEPYRFRRKTSADAMPFDLERAKAGDMVEWFFYDEWKVINNAHYSQIGISKMHGRIDIGFTGRGSKWVMEKHLRMKYPPKKVKQ